jgi:hypothetical protein
LVSQAEAIKNLIETNWNLTGSLSKTPSDTMKEVVRFFDRPQVLGNEWPKAVEVVKINLEEEEGVVEHPNFIEISDMYEITLRYRVKDVSETVFSQALDDIEQMATEVISILDAQFSPTTSTEGYFVTRKRWRKDDHVDQAQPELKRILSMELTQLKGQDNTVYRGDEAVMIMDVSEMTVDNEPAGDYTYTELRELSIVEGYNQIPHLTKDTTRGRKIPHYVNGIFSGVFSALLLTKTADLVGATAETIQQLVKLQTGTGRISQKGEIVMLHQLQNLNSQTNQTKSFMRITEVHRLTTDESLLAYRILGILTQPTEYATI